MQYLKRKNMKEPSKTIDYYMLPNKILCSMAGLWPIDEKSSTSTKAFAYIRLIFGFVAFNSIFVPEIMMIILNWGDLRVLAGVGCVLTTVGQSYFKMAYLVMRKDKSCRLYNELRDLWDSTDDPIERKNYENLAYWGRVITLILQVVVTWNVSLFTIVAAYDSFIEYNVSNAETSRHLPFEVWYGVDITPSPCFEIVFFCQLVMAEIVASAVAGVDGLCMATILHVSGQFKLISTWINKMGLEIGVEPVHSRKLEANLHRCIRHHQRMIKLPLMILLLLYSVVNDLNNLLTPIVFVQLLTSGIEICLSGFAVFDHDVGGDILKFIFYMLAAWLQLMLWCWHGEILLQVSLDVGHVVYLNVPWYNLPTIHQKKLCMMMVRAQQYCSITALTFQTVSIHTLTSVFNTAASYFTLLRKMQQT